MKTLLKWSKCWITFSNILVYSTQLEEIYIESAEAMVSKNGDFTSVKTVVPTGTRNYCILYHHAQARPKKPASPKNVYDEAIKMISFMKFQLLCTHLFSNLWDKCLGVINNFIECNGVPRPQNFGTAVLNWWEPTIFREMDASDLRYASVRGQKWFLLVPETREHRHRWKATQLPCLNVWWGLEQSFWKGWAMAFL